MNFFCRCNYRTNKDTGREIPGIRKYEAKEPEREPVPDVAEAAQAAPADADTQQGARPAGRHIGRPGAGEYRAPQRHAAARTTAE